MKRSCKTCERFQRPAPRKHKKCLDGIISCRKSWKGDCCLWWKEKEEA